MTSGFFCVAKDEDTDRTITNRKPRNAVEALLGACGEWLPHGCSLCDFQVGLDEVVLVSMDDLADYYHSIPTPQLAPPQMAWDYLWDARRWRVFAA